MRKKILKEAHFTSYGDLLLFANTETNEVDEIVEIMLDNATLNLKWYLFYYTFENKI